MNGSWGSVGEMGVSVIQGRPWKNLAVVEGGGWAAMYLLSRMMWIFMPLSGRHSFLSPTSSNPFLVLLSLNRTNCDGIQSTTGLIAMDSQL